ncbi:MAG: monosaccharide transporter substrate-binding protein family [Acidobacteriaceae bacterium]|nr:monosaccharide transporter substrate-binding protein family [Acidobacteriaceae bacterium]
MHRTLWKATLGAIGTACLLATTSCAKHSYSDQYYLVATNIKLPYWQMANNGLMKAASQYGVKAEMRGTDTFDPQGEVAEFRTAVGRKPAGILVSVADPGLMQAEIDKAISSGIPVLTIDSDSPNSHRLFFIGTNNLQAGRLGGLRVVQKLHGKGNVVFFSMPGQPNLDERLRGYQDAFANSSGIRIVDVVNIKGESTAAFDNTQAMLAKTGKDKIDAFICLEASAGKDVAEALKRAHATDRELVAMDVDEATLNLVKEGVIDATVGQKPFTMAYFGLKQVVELHENPLKQLGRDFETDSFSPVPAFVDTGATLVDKNNVDLFLRARQESAQ